MGEPNKSVRLLGLGGRIFGALFFGVFPTVGLIFAGIMTRKFAGTTATESWPSATEELTRAEITVNEKSKTPLTL